MTAKEAWNLGYDEACKNDYESSQYMFVGHILRNMENRDVKIPKGFKGAFLDGIKANWRDLKNA